MTAPNDADEARARKRRRLELAAAFVLLLAVVLATWVQLAYFGTDSWMFLGLLNLNVVLMLVVFFLVARNVVKLLLERRRKTFGARLRTRLLLAFVSVSLVPVVIIFLAANRVLGTSVDYWFTSQVENSMQAALEVGQSFYNASAARLRGNAGLLLDELKGLPFESPEMDELLVKRQRETGLILAGFILRRPPEGQAAEAPPVYMETMWHVDPRFAPVWNQARYSMKWDVVSRTGFDSLLWADPSGDYVICALAMPGSEGVYLVAAESIGRGLLSQLERISKGFEEYTQRKSLKKPLKFSFTMVLALLSLTMVFGAVWLAFRLSRQLTDPIMALAQGTDQMARGDLDFSLEDAELENAGKDELGQLVSSFNRMAREVRESHDNLVHLNALLEERGTLLAERNQYIETVLEHIATGVITLDAEGRILTMNKAACTMFATTAQQWKGRKPALLLQPEYGEAIRAMYAFLRRHPESLWQQMLEFTWRGRHWKLVIHAVALPGLTMPQDAPRADEYGSVVAVFEDITELARMQRFAAWREVAKRIAHEIKNPLTPIKLSAERIERKFAAQVNDPALAQCTALIVREVERMQNMVTEFSAFASLPEVVLTPGNLLPLLEELITLSRASRSRLEWVLDVEPLPEARLLDMRLDADAMHRALLNVLNNAAEALEAGGAPNGRIVLRVRRTPASIVLEVEDNGPGLPDEDLDRLFEPYFSRKRGGTGLGLAIVRSVVHDHGGVVSAANAPGGGLIIRMEFRGEIKAV